MANLCWTGGVTRFSYPRHGNHPQDLRFCRGCDSGRNCHVRDQPISQSSWLRVCNGSRHHTLARHCHALPLAQQQCYPCRAILRHLAVSFRDLLLFRR